MVKRTAESLPDKAQQLAVTLLSIGDGLIATDVNGGVTLMNPVAERLTGYSQEEAAGLPLEDIFHIVNEESRKEVKNPIHRALREGVVVGLANHTLLIAKDGTERPIADSAAPILDTGGKTCGVVLVFRDQTKERQAERAVRESEERLHLLIEGVKDYALYMLDPTGHVISWNSGAERIKGYSAAEIIGRHFRCFYLPEEAAAGKPERVLETARRAGRFEEEAWRVRKDGSRFWASVILTALYDTKGQLRGFSKVTRDLTVRHLHEERAKELFREQTARAAAESLAREMAQARREAELANRSKDEFLAVLGHELRNPLAPILTALHLLRLRAGDAFTRECKIIERQVKHMVRLVDDLLDISRITSGKVELRKEPVVISETVARAVEMSRPLLEERQHDLTVSVAPELCVLGDDVRLSQVVANLLNNAAKYTEKGGRITVAAEPDGESVLIRVSDNGIGIAPELLPRIFDIFVQERQSLDRAPGGLGLGLSIVRSLVKLHGGSVSVHSDGLGTGAEVCIRLPALTLESCNSAELPHARPSLKMPKHSSARILVVDDNADAAQLLAEGLESLGYETYVAYDGPSALELAEKVRPSVAILDIGLPVMDGYELARRLRALPGLAHTQLIAVTGYGQPSDRQRSVEVGFNAHLVKPVEIPAVQTTLERLLPEEVAD